MVAQVAGQSGNLLVVGGDHASFAGGDDLVGVEAETASISQTAGALTFVFGPMRFGGVFHHV